MNDKDMILSMIEGDTGIDSRILLDDAQFKNLLIMFCKDTLNGAKYNAILDYVKENF